VRGAILLSYKEGTIMNITLTIQEYRDLLDILHLADVVMSGHRRERDKRTDRHRVLIQTLYALAKEEGLGHLIDRVESANKYIQSRAFEWATLAHTVIDEFGDHLFWDQLITRLAERDTVQAAGGIDRLNAMSDSDRLHTAEHIRPRYVEEFAKHGVSNLAVVEQFSPVGDGQFKTSD
jgi:hypothetical protein